MIKNFTVTQASTEIQSVLMITRNLKTQNAIQRTEVCHKTIYILLPTVLNKVVIEVITVLRSSMTEPALMNSGRNTRVNFVLVRIDVCLSAFYRKLSSFNICIHIQKQKLSSKRCYWL